VVFLGSETGDSHLIQLNPTGDISVFDTFHNVAPITDAVLADLDNSDEPAVVTCSGGGRTGSLRIIRTGANIEELASITGVDGVRDVFTLSGIDGYAYECLGNVGC
jgi:DNA damage-binding protein 1